MPTAARRLSCFAIAAALVCGTADAHAEENGQEPPKPTDFALRLALPAVGATVAFGDGRAHPAALLAWPFQYPLDDLLVAHLRVILEPQVILPPTETIAFRVRLGLRYVPRLRGLMDEHPRFFVGAGVSLSSKVAVSGELGWRLPFEWPKWTFFAALRYDRRFTGNARNEVALLGGFTFF